MITAVIPKLPFTDRQKTLEYYEGLGFGLVSDYGDYLILKMGEAELHFFLYADLQPEASDFMIYLRMDAGIEAYYEKLRNLGIAIHPNGALQRKAWQQIEFSLLDPNGTLLTFGQPTDK